jgi:hypothetical protein
MKKKENNMDKYGINEIICFIFITIFLLIGTNKPKEKK